MSKTWKWILGILAVLLIVGVFFTIGYAWRTQNYGMTPYRMMPYDQNWNGPMGRGNDGWSHPQMWDRSDGWSHPMMDGGRGFIPFGGFFVLGGILRFALFIGLLYGAYWLGRRNARIALDPSAGSGPAAPVANSPAPQADDQPQG